MRRSLVVNTGGRNHRSWRGRLLVRPDLNLDAALPALMCASVRAVGAAAAQDAVAPAARLRLDLPAASDQDLDFTSLVITNHADGIVATFAGNFGTDDNKFYSLAPVLLSAGNYRLVISGVNSTAQASYAGDLAIAAAIPETSTGALSLGASARSACSCGGARCAERGRPQAACRSCAQTRWGTPSSPHANCALARTLRPCSCTAPDSGRTLFCGSLPAAPVARPTALMRDGSDAHAFIHRAVHERVREAMQGKQPSPSGSRCAEPGIGGDQSCRPCELGKKSVRDRCAGPCAVKSKRFSKFLFCLRREKKAHFNFARNRDTASSPGIQVDRPASISASRRSASTDHASSHSGSGSRLASSLSSKRDRSAGGRPRTSTSRTSTGIDMVHLCDCQRAQMASMPQTNTCFAAESERGAGRSGRCHAQHRKTRSRKCNDDDASQLIERLTRYCG